MERDLVQRNSTRGTMFETQGDRSLARAEEVAKPGFLPFPPSDVQRSIVYLLQSHVGLSRAIPIIDISFRLKVSSRVVKDAVRALRMQPFVVPIGSSRSGDGGYFLCATVDEKLETARQYMRQATSELAVVRDMLEPHELREELGQMGFALKGDHLG